MTDRQCFDLERQAEGKKHKKQVQVKDNSFLFGRRERQIRSSHRETSSLFNKLGIKSKSLSSIRSGSSRSTKYTKKSKANVTFSKGTSTREPVTENFSEIERIRSSEQSLHRNPGRSGFWGESSFLRKSKSLSSIYFDLSNKNQNTNTHNKLFPVTEPASSKVFSGVDFGLDKAPSSDQQSISESVLSKFWAATDIIFPPTENQTVTLPTAPTNSTTPLLPTQCKNNTANNRGDIVQNQNTNLSYDSLTTSPVLSNQVLDHPLQILPQEPILFENLDFFGNEPYLNPSPSSTKAKKSVNDSFCSSYQSDISEIFFPQEEDLNTDNKTSSNLPSRSSRTHNLFSASNIFSSETIYPENYNNWMVEEDIIVSPSDIQQFTPAGNLMDNTCNLPPSHSEIPDNPTDSVNQQNTSSHSSSRRSHTVTMFLGIFVRCLNAMLNIKTVADCLCFPFDVIITSPKVSILSVLGFWLVLNLIILPFRFIIAFIMREPILYLSMLSGIFVIGRFIVRMIAFPGSSFRVYGEVEKEFTKYSLKMLDNASTSLCELAAVILIMSPESDSLIEELKKTKFEFSSTRFKKSDLIPSYTRTKSYRDRVLGLYLDIFNCIFDENGDGVEKKDGNEECTLFTKYGNNILIGDIGKISTVSDEAKTEGRILHNLLKEVLNDLKELEEEASNLFNSSLKMLPKREPSARALKAANSLLFSSSKLKELLSSMKATSEKMAHSLSLEESSETSDEYSEDDSNHSSNVKNEDSVINILKSGVRSLIPILDPPPHYSIFGLDVLRGCMLSRYIGARQLWVKRPDGGFLDVIHIPCTATTQTNNEQKQKAVLYCNPNAGLTECATGMSLIGGNVGKTEDFEDTCWADYYICNGFDIYMFNYAGFGRSSGYSIDTRNNYRTGIFSMLLRIFYRSCVHFKPTPYSMKSDAFSVASYIVNEIGVDKLVIHGESIGGMAAASAARKLSDANGGENEGLALNQFPSLLLCDRTFCNLPAVAQRLVGGWTGYVIPILTPLWSTDVAGDFINARCPKIVAQDASDGIIHDAGSLKSGLAIAQERLKGKTNNVGLKEEAPLEYRMADWENVGVSKSRIVKTLANFSIQGPSWPSDKHITIREAFHFAACAKRIGKVATALKKGKTCNVSSTHNHSAYSDEEHGIEILVLKNLQDNDSKNENETYEERRKELIMKAWKILASCDGMTGMHCGAAVKQGYDCTVTWLYSTVAFGGQVVASAARKRNTESISNAITSDDKFDVSISDFGIVENCQFFDDETALHPLPIPEVITRLKNIVEESKYLGDVETELRYCIIMLEYVVERLMSKYHSEQSFEAINLVKKDDISVGCFLNLECGHNNQFLQDEKVKLSSYLKKLS